MTKANSNKIKNMGIVCAMLVVFIHVGKPSVVGSPGWWLYQFTAEGVSRIAVPFFFLCSGYFLANHFSDRGWYASEVGKRIRTLLVPYLLWSLLFYLFVLCMFLISPDNPAYWSPMLKKPISSHIMLAFGLSPGKLPLLYPLWYLRFLFLLVLLSPMFAFAAKHAKAFLLVILAALYLAFNPGDGSPIGIHIGIPFEGVFYFYCGILLHQDTIRSCVKRISDSPAVYLWVCVLVSIVIRAIFFRYVGHFYSLIKPMFIGLGLAALWRIIPDASWSNKFVSLSFLIYVTHVFGIQLFSFIFGRDSENIGMLLGRVCFGLCLALLISYVLKNVVGNRIGLLWGGRR